MTEKRAWTGRVLVCGALGVGMPLLCQFFPVIRVLTHEFTQLFTVLSFYVLGMLAWGVAKRARTTGPDRAGLPLHQESLLAALVCAALCGAAAFAVMAAANALGPRCQFAPAASFYWLTWTPAVLLACVLGCARGARGARWWTTLLLLTGAVLLSAAQDFIQLWHGMRVGDLIIGEPAALNQRMGMTPTPFHVHQRVFTLLLAGAVWHAALWGAARRDVKAARGGVAAWKTARLRGLFALALLLGAALAGGSHLGVGWGRGALLSHLSQTLRTEHFIIHHAPSGEAANRIAEIGRHAEWCMDHLRKRWNIAPEKPVTVYCFNGQGEMMEHTGMGAHAVVRTIFVDAYQARNSTMLHELIHAVHVEINPKWTTALNRGITEGTAEAFENHYTEIPEAHRREAGALRHGRLPSAAVFMDLLGFWKMNENNAYTAAASFMGFLVQEYGMEKFLAFQPTLDFGAVYGMNLEQLDAAWRAFLEKVPVDQETQLRAAESYDPAFWGEGYFDCDCPKLGDTVEKPEARAQNLWNAGNYRAALEAYGELTARDNSARWAGQMALCLQKLAREDEAAALLREQLAREDLTEFDRRRLEKMLPTMLMTLRDWDGLYALLEAQLALEQDPAAVRDRQAVLACMRNPAVRDAVAQALTTEDFTTRRGILAGLTEANPEDAELRHLYLTRGLATDYPRGTRPMRERVAELLDVAVKYPEVALNLAGSLRFAASRLIEEREYDLAGSICDTLMETLTDPLQRAAVERLRARLVFDRAYAPAWQ
ncbi:MAG: hypothetical protein GX580_00795 [Candidatus Hydrogenedens sp.]|nr:hypothetical protein [Candidatus Hydrogenedentota bacterium]NLF56158.1 hypothetical protein [Candidatus Hydrogenedens sp.]